MDVITWSGDYRQCARTLSFNLLSVPEDARIPVIPCDLGNSVVLKQDSRVLFDGFAVSRQKSTDSNKISVTCFDRGFYLNRNKAVYQFQNQTAEAIARRVCSDFGITVGTLAETGGSITRNFIGVELYKIIITAYTLAAAQTKKQYQVFFSGDKLFVTEKKVNEETLVIEGKSNLMGAACTDSIQNMVNQVAVYDKDDKPLRTAKDEALIKAYGLMQGYLKQREGDDPAAAEKMLAENGYEQKMTIENLGNIACITGGTVVVKEPYTGICGLFYIDSDVHTWKNGLYFNKLTLNFKSVMDEQEAGSLPNKTGSKTAGKEKLKTLYYTHPNIDRGEK